MAFAARANRCTWDAILAFQFFPFFWDQLQYEASSRTAVGGNALSGFDKVHGWEFVIVGGLSLLAKSASNAYWYCTSSYQI